jgi:biotin carboxylase
MSDVVVIVDPYSTGSALAGQLHRAGFRTVAVTSVPEPGPYYRATFRPADFEAVLSESDGVPALLAELRRWAPVAVVAGTETGVELADRLAPELTPDRANDPGLGRARRHKGAMMAALAAAGLPAIRSVTAADAGTIRRWIDEQHLRGRDLVLKPVLTAGSEGLTLLPGGTGLDAALDDVLGLSSALSVRTDEVIVQERLHGTEYAVDTFTADGRHTTTSICRYRKVPNGDRFAVYESTDYLGFDAPGHDELIAHVHAGLDALGIRFGFAHTEIMVTADGCRIIEVGARLAGGGLPRAAALAYGVTGLERLGAALRGEPMPDGFDRRRHVRAVYFIAARAGEVANTDAYRRLSTLPSCRYLKVGVRDGDRVEPTSSLLSSLALGSVLLAHRDPAQIDRDHRELREIESEVLVGAVSNRGDWT